MTTTKDTDMTDDWIAETVSVSELFQEELDLVIEQIDRLINSGTDDELKVAENLEQVVKYLKARIITIREHESMVNQTLH
jgi:hypothetical protein